MKKRCKDLPDECWEIIFNKLGHHSNLQPLILVCRQFLSIIRHIRTTFYITIPTVLVHGENLLHILNQFPNIKSINLRQAGDSTPRLLEQMAPFLSNIQSLDISEGSYMFVNQVQVFGPNMKNLRILKCSKVRGFSDKQLAVITNFISSVEELDISYPQPLSQQNEIVQGANVTLSGIDMLSLKMKGLRKINLSGNQYVTDKSLICLSSNCTLLEQVVARGCEMITVAGVQFLVRNSSKLESLVVSQINFRNTSLNLSTGDCFSFAKHLSSLDIDDAGVKNKFLHSLSVCDIPLKSFTLSHCDGFFCHGITVFLKRYPSLEYFYLTDVTFPYNTYVVEEWSGYFAKLTTIKLKVCNITEATLFMLIKTCPLLEYVDMGNTLIGTGNKAIDLFSKSRIKSMHLSCNPYLSDELLAKLALICPCLEIFGLSYCSKITEIGVSNILNQCSIIRCLEINGSEGIKNIGDGYELPKLEVLSVEKSGINDEGLGMIGHRCYRLLNLNLGSCLQITDEGLRKMLKDCRRLREINLSQCVNVGLEIIDWMVFSKPSLRKIVPPSPSFPDVGQMQYYLRHGCYVWTPPPADEEYGEKKYCFFYEMTRKED